MDDLVVYVQREAEKEEVHPVLWVLMTVTTVLAGLTLVLVLLTLGTVVVWAFTGWDELVRRLVLTTCAFLGAAAIFTVAVMIGLEAEDR